MRDDNSTLPLRKRDMVLVVSPQHPGFYQRQHVDTALAQPPRDGVSDVLIEVEPDRLAHPSPRSFCWSSEGVLRRNSSTNASPFSIAWSTSF